MEQIISICNGRSFSIHFVFVREIKINLIIIVLIKKQGEERKHSKKENNQTEASTWI